MTKNNNDVSTVKNMFIRKSPNGTVQF